MVELQWSRVKTEFDNNFGVSTRPSKWKRLREVISPNLDLRSGVFVLSFGAVQPHICRYLGMIP